MSFSHFLWQFTSQSAKTRQAFHTDTEKNPQLFRRKIANFKNNEFGKKEKKDNSALYL
jgi:hypothetical protein